jgi:hypothetical protein
VQQAQQRLHKAQDLHKRDVEVYKAAQQKTQQEHPVSEQLKRKFEVRPAAAWTPLHPLPPPPSSCVCHKLAPSLHAQPLARPFLERRLAH